MTEQTGTGGVGVIIGASTWRDIVIKLEVTNAVFADQTVDYRIEMPTRRWIAQVKQIAFLLHHAFSMPLEERGIRQLLRHG